MDNWEQISKVLAKKYEWTIDKKIYEPIAFQAPDVAEKFLEQLYETCTNKKLKLDKKPVV